MTNWKLNPTPYIVKNHFIIYKLGESLCGKNIENISKINRKRSLMYVTCEVCRKIGYKHVS